MVEHQRADARFGVHHASVGEAHADVLGPQELPDGLLILQVRAGRISEAVALAAIARREALVHRHGGRVGEAPILADAAVQPFGAAFRRLEPQRLDGVHEQVLARLLGLLGALADARSRSDHKYRDVIAPAVQRVQHVVAQRQAVLARLAAEPEGVNRRSAPRRK